jgi:hypothetical protein
MPPPAPQPSLYETGPLGIANRLLEVRIRKTNVATNAFSSPPGKRGFATKAVELGDERRRAFETVSGDHGAMVPLRHGTCQR